MINVIYPILDDAMPAAPAVTGKPGNNIANFGNLSITIAPRTNELDDYLCLSVTNITYPLIWSNNNWFVYPTLHCLALDYLSALATSTTVK
jgi:hypothetical protein